MAQAIALCGFIAPVNDLSGAWDVPGEIVWWASAVLMGIAVVLTVVSGLEFARDALRQRRQVTAN